VCEAVVAGTLPSGLYETLNRAGSTPGHATCLLSVGETPSIGSWVGPEAEGGVLAAAAALAVTAVSAVATGVFNLLRSAAKPAAGGPAQGAPGKPGTAAVDELPQALHAAPHAGFDDQPRRGRTLHLAPRGALAAATDSLGRVLLLDLQAGPLCVSRLWKGYRDAEVAWVDGCAPPGPDACPPLCLAIHAPHRNGLLEVWGMRHGQRMGKLRCGANCRLLAAPPLLGLGASTALGSEPAPACRAYVLDGSSGDLKAFDWQAA
jgi:hypothetical protein